MFCHGTTLDDSLALLRCADNRDEHEHRFAEHEHDRCEYDGTLNERCAVDWCARKCVRRCAGNDLHGILMRDETDSDWPNRYPLRKPEPRNAREDGLRHLHEWSISPPSPVISTVIRPKLHAASLIHHGQPHRHERRDNSSIQRPLGERFTGTSMQTLESACMGVTVHQNRCWRGV